MKLELEPKDGEVLAAVLDEEISDLRMEIADTDSMDVREELKARKEILMGILARLTSAGAPVSADRS